MKCSFGISDFLEEISSLSHAIAFLCLCIDHWGRLSYLFLLFFGTLHSDGYIFPFLLSLFQDSFPTQGSNPGLPHCRWILYQLSCKESLRILEWVAYPFSSRSEPGSSISSHWSLKKAFLSLLAILWNSAFRCLYLSFPPLLFSSLLFTAICKASPDSHFAFLHFLSMGMVLIPVSLKDSKWSSVPKKS